RPAQRTGSLPCYRTDVDNHAVLPLQHLRQDVVDAVKGAVQVGPDELLPALRRELADLPLLDVQAGVVHQDVNTSAAARGVLDEATDLLGFAHVGRVVGQPVAARQNIK